MNYDEFAFTNQQLASMLKSGVPLEGALEQLCATMQKGELRHELEALRAELVQGIPLKKAISSRRFPELYVRMLQAGAQSNDLPGMLTIIADYYHRKNLLWTRLKGLLVYPFIVLCASLAISILLAFLLRSFMNEVQTAWVWIPSREILPGLNVTDFMLLSPVLLFSAGLIAVVLIMTLPRLRRWFQWRTPAYRDASISQFASSLQLLLKQRINLGDALALMSEVERSTPLGEEIARWQSQLRSGVVKSRELAPGSKIIPPLFFWLLAGEEENWVVGLGRASQLYYQRATRRIEMLLYAVLPVSVVVLALLILTEVYPVIFLLTRIMKTGFGNE